MARILVVDDDQMLCGMVCHQLNILGHKTDSAHSLAQGLRSAVSQRGFDIVILDVRLPDGSGLESLPLFKAALSQPEIIITGEGDIDGAELAIETGAWDYIEKPISMREITLQVTRALQYRHEKVTRSIPTLFKRKAIIGSSPILEICLEKMAQSAGTDAPVLITGETGTGKELFARAIHDNSRRSSGPFVVLDCAAFPENLVESMLFGHCKGAFTGAEQERQGLIMQADKGTLFMDEVGELSLTVQKAFLRVLQERRLRPLGGKNELESDFRLIAATNRDLARMVESGHFRKDLLFRLKAATIQLPTLKERKTDIENLAMHYISSLCKRYGMDPKGVSNEFIQALEAYAWPGNVRELINAIDSAITAAQDHGVLYPMHLPVNIRVNLRFRQQKNKAVVPRDRNHRTTDVDGLPSLKDSLEQAEKQYFELLMSRINGNIQAACRISGLSRSGVYARLKKYGISRTI
jgi:DNA-binding NtrC family response regulator